LLYGFIKNNEVYLINNLIFIACVLFAGILSLFPLFIIIVISFVVFYMHKLIKKNKLLYSKKYNLLLLIFNVVNIYRIIFDVYLYTVFSWVSIIYWILIYLFGILLLKQIKKIKLKKILIILFYIVYFLCLSATIFFEVKEYIELQKEQQNYIELWNDERNNINIV
jgi:hypothetical protein